MELIDHDTGLGQHSLDRCPVGVPHVHADDLDLLPVFQLHQVVGHHVLAAGGQQVEQGSLLNVGQNRSEEHTSELQSLMRISYAVFCLKKKNNQQTTYNR